MSDQLNNPARNNEKHDHDYRIIVNGEKKIVESDVISYDAVVLLAYPTPPAPNTIYTVSYEKAKDPHEGELVAGQSVTIKEGTEFDVTPTTKS
ncbi:multiubiquitin domain-containing protein [Alicyclobacillus sp. ALC3]|uniref:multiubiquitin domain-containing protein n=1 Tax=Alicyclobacillus sp. ALC3 TaxID=2796143 RepID=UPI0019D42BB2|nr:multiubiquitin domain-containing protein [Alicyclobacillus sp. ALC3]QSO53143.1 multiubiquitin domain-containing protein [Alicyclobacillus curvatus]WDL96483.1 multiubiquitin domain-containing protein [Alicyclobacillus sp. ALC3]